MVQYTIWQVEFTIKQIILQQEQISDKKECLQTCLSVSLMNEGANITLRLANNCYFVQEP